MKYILLIAAFCAAISLSAQSPLFYAFGNVQSSVSVGGGQYNITISNFNGGYKAYPDANYDATDIPASPTDFVVWGACSRLVVVSKVSNVPFVLRVQDTNGILAAGDLNGARITIGQEARHNGYNLGFQPNVADGNAGAQAGVGPYEAGCIENYYKYQLSQLAANTDEIAITSLSAPPNSLAITDGYRLAMTNSGTGPLWRWDGTAWTQIGGASFTIFGPYVDQNAAASGGVTAGQLFYVGYGSTVYPADMIVRKN